MKQNPFVIRSLDGIRAVAFLMVFISHSWLSRIGVFGVSVFFFLSGYLITTLLRIENDERGTISLRKFYMRRSLRIFPPFYLTIATIVLLVRTHVATGNLQMRPILAAALYAGNYWAVFRGFHFLPGFTPFWSLAVEEHFYLCFPLAFVLMGRAKLSYKVQALALATVCAIVLAWRLTLVLGMGVVNEDRLLFSTDTRVDMMLFGCILALGMNPVLDEKAKPSLSLSALAVIAILVTVVVRNPIMHAAVRYSLQGLALIPLFTVAILSHKWYTNWLNWRLLRFVGTLSYALYLIHLAILDTVREHIRSMPVVATLVTLAVSFAYAYLMKIGVEAPINRLRKKFRNTREETSSGKGPAATEATFQLGAFGVAEE